MRRPVRGMLMVRRNLPSALRLTRKPGKPTELPRPLLDRVNFRSPPSSDLLFRNCHLPISGTLSLRGE